MSIIADCCTALDCAGHVESRSTSFEIQARLQRSEARPEESMVYVQRDADGLLLRVESRPFEGMTDTLAVESAELATWLKTREEIHGRLQALKQTDMDMVRVLEDVVIVLVERGVISFTDLPEAARQKLDERALARADLEGFSGAITGRLGRQAVVDR
ncbi:hypothetical protein SAMN05216421_3261 [Halopseudomonas xinjiangensis]|uniref:Tryptophan synthase subunit beta n=2 Tax=Halopseudomonas xinjiangensis TaxID=487184 RepID=A0A1H1YSS9_9GAMM|nr:hypothetical protein SAMN05216421_3261 [Halopseudomonas xinjiangensis]